MPPTPNATPTATNLFRNAMTRPPVARAALCVSIGAALALGMALPATAQTPLENAVRTDDVLRIKKGDAKMAAAMRRAQATLGEFLTLARDPKPSMSGFTVKAPLPAGGHNEYVWLQPFRVDEAGRIAGVLNNTPVDTDAFRKGQTLIFPKSAVVDWGYYEGGRMRGNFTTCVLLARAPKRTRSRPPTA